MMVSDFSGNMTLRDLSVWQESLQENMRRYPDHAHESEMFLKNIEEAHKKWDAECGVLYKRYQLDALEQRASSAYNERCLVEEKILATPAHTMIGVLIKLTLWRFENRDVIPNKCGSVERDDEIILAAINDVERITGITIIPQQVELAS